MMIIDERHVESRLGFWNFPPSWTEWLQESLHIDEQLVLVGETTLSLVRVLQKQIIKTSPSYIKIKPQVIQSFPIRPEMASKLMRLRSFQGELNQKMVTGVQNVLLGIPIYLTFTINPDHSLSAEYLDLERDYSVRATLEGEAWHNYRTALLELKEKLDTAVRLQSQSEREGVLESLVALSWQLLERLRLSSLLKTLEDNPYRNIKIYQRGDSIYLPLEALFPKALVSYYVPTQKKNDRASNRLVMMYDPSLPDAALEANLLIQNGLESFKSECFTLSNFKDYRESFLKAAVFHFMGHGSVREGKGALLMIGEAITHIHAPVLVLAFLNACLSGYLPNGIVSALLNEGAHGVIASPYALSDNEMTRRFNIRDFYSQFNLADCSASYYLYALQNPHFNLLYRFYAGYQTQGGLE